MFQEARQYLTALVERWHERGLMTRRDIGVSWAYPPTDRQRDKLRRLVVGMGGIDIPRRHSVMLRACVKAARLDPCPLNRAEFSDLLAVLEKVSYYRSWPAATTRRVQRDASTRSV